MNRLLRRQIKEFFGVEENIPEHLLLFVEQVSAVYDDFDRDRSIMERAIDVSSQEMIEQNQTLEHAHITRIRLSLACASSCWACSRV